MKTTLFLKMLVIVWLSKNDWQAGIDSLEKNADIIQEVSPAWFAPSSDGKVVPISGVPVNDSKLLSIVRTHGIRLRPILMNVSGSGFDPGLIRPILSNPQLRKHHVAVIVELVKNGKYDGIDIDYESLSPSEIPQFADFIVELSGALKAIRKTVAVDLQAKFVGQNSEALRRIATVTDSVRLMVYPEHTESTPPGPLASLGWIRERLFTAEKDIPREKLALGMATYARTWNPASTGTWAGLVDPAFGRGIAISRDDDDVPWYRENGKTVYFEDAQSIKRKIQTAKGSGVGQIAFWRLGGEDPEIWTMLRNEK